MLRRDSHSKSAEWNRVLPSAAGTNGNGAGHNSGSSIGGGGPGALTFSRSHSHSHSRSSSTSSLPSPEAQEAKSDAAVAILASAVYLWDFFLSADSHASLGLARDTSAYVALQELLAERVVPGGPRGGGEGGEKGRDAGVDHAVSVGKALLDVQRHMLRKVPPHPPESCLGVSHRKQQKYSE